MLDPWTPADHAPVPFRPQGARRAARRGSCHDPPVIRPVLLRLLAALLPCATAFAACDPTASPRPRVVAYFASWGVYARDFQVADIDASKLTHVQYAFANIDEYYQVLGVAADGSTEGPS